MIPQIANSAQAILANFGATDDAIFDVLFGRFKPQGKLPFDMPSSWESVLKQKGKRPWINRLFCYGRSFGASVSSLLLSCLRRRLRELLQNS